MDAKYFKILTFLYDKGVGEFTNISTTLLDLYPGVDRMDFDRAMHESGNVRRLLKSMVDDKLIVVQDFSIGSGNKTGGVAWLDTTQIHASITQLGKNAVDSEKDKGETARLMESTILTNESVRETNIATINNLKFQKTSQIWTIGLGALSTVFILATVIQAIFDKTTQSIQQLNQSMQTLTLKTQKLDSSLQEIKSAIETKKIDTVFVFQK
ncbi:hypothetical protein BH10BAC3_BH10BAC3_31210 [soil metagenome]